MQTGVGGVWLSSQLTSITGQDWAKLRQKNCRAPGAPWLRQGATLSFCVTPIFLTLTPFTVRTPDWHLPF